MTKKRILFLLSDTGGGHRSAAKAITEGLHHINPKQYHVFIEDVWQIHTPYPFNQIPKLYPWFISSGLPLWQLMWWLSTQTQAHLLLFKCVLPIVRNRLIAFLRMTRPDIIVSVHPFMNHVIMQLVSEIGLTIPFLTVVTDLVNVHPAWICPDVSYCLVPTEPARQHAIRFGMDSNKVTVAGQPISLKFGQKKHDKETLRKKLTLSPNRKTVLIMGGGEGFGNIFEIARHIAQRLSHVQMIVVTGRNHALWQKLKKVHWEIPTKIYSFVNNIPDLMWSADVLISKAGPNTISEALVANLPMIISGYIPGQETGNIAYIQHHQAGVFASNPVQIAMLVLRWFEDGQPFLQRMATNAAAIAKPRAALIIAKHVANLI
ncbi:MAG: hypothetical protein B6242_03185 [Anaerolineaceae bacterium 4572_78]|nr:MAG: hypothetical protein B6242_03185 [Anaerolineaceae bacterium 4572_78]